MHDYLRGTRSEVVLRKQWKPAAYTMADGWNVVERVNPPVLQSELLWKRHTPRPKPAARHRAACAAMSTPCSTLPSAWPATAAWTSARKT
jgi:hypothetical protein